MKDLERVMAEGHDEKEEEKTPTIHETGGKFDDNVTIYAIEKAFHPRSKENVRDELVNLVDSFLEERWDRVSGSIKGPGKAAEEFMEFLAEDYFGPQYKTMDQKLVRETVEQKYGVSKKALRTAFGRKGAYRNREQFYAQHVDPMADRVDEDRKKTAQASLEFYLKTPETRTELNEHMQIRNRPLELSDDYLKIMSLEDTVKGISNYMAIPDAIEKIDADKKAELGMSRTQAGSPEIYHIFAKGELYREVNKRAGKPHETDHRLQQRDKAA